MGNWYLMLFVLGFNRKGRKGFARDAIGCFSRKGAETRRFALLITRFSFFSPLCYLLSDDCLGCLYSCVLYPGESD